MPTCYRKPADEEIESYSGVAWRAALSQPLDQLRSLGDFGFLAG
jgi:hypothetical protein